MDHPQVLVFFYLELSQRTPMFLKHRSLLTLFLSITCSWSWIALVILNHLQFPTGGHTCTILSKICILKFLTWLTPMHPLPTCSVITSAGSPLESLRSGPLCTPKPCMFLSLPLLGSIAMATCFSSGRQRTSWEVIYLSFYHCRIV